MKVARMLYKMQQGGINGTVKKIVTVGHREKDSKEEEEAQPI